jgi:hypothetical protein
MRRRFVSDFLLPLVRGGAVSVARPLGPVAVAALLRDLPIFDAEAIVALARYRRLAACRCTPFPISPPLDEATVRLGAALHNLLALGHPELAGPRTGRRQERIAGVAAELASLGPPRTADEAVRRHSLLARLPDITRVDRTVHFWLGRQAFVGRTPPRRVTALPGLRRVRIDQTNRSWLREIGIPVVGRRAFLAVNVASPLGEALDPLRLDPPLAWGRILPVLRFPVLARAVAGRAVEIGLDRVGDAMAEALYRFAGFHDPPIGVHASAEAMTFAIRFLAHVVWLDVLFRGPAIARPERGDSDRGVEAGVDLAVVITAAARTRPSLVWPPDVSPDGDLGRSFAACLDAMAARAENHGMPRLQAALGIVALAGDNSHAALRYD